MLRDVALSEFRPAAPPQPLSDSEIHLWFFPHWRGPTRHAAESLPILQLLANYAGCDPEALRFQRATHGKPLLAGGELEFNLSHSGPALLLALSRKQPLGVDLEMARRPRPVLELAQRYFGSDETAALSALPASLQQQAFLDVWACKEAVLKAHGGGISLGLDLVTFNVDRAGIVQSLAATHGPLSSPNWRIVRLALGDKAAAAIAWRGAEHRIQAYKVEL